MSTKEKLIEEKRALMLQVKGLIYMGRPKIGKHKEVNALFNKIKKLTEKIEAYK